jgi:DNA-binding FadR family transcriptional regulator
VFRTTAARRDGDANDINRRRAGAVGALLPQFEAISRRTVAEGVREALLEKIRTGALRPGSQLPSERVLCEQFVVARTSVREAIQGLASLGLVERRGNRLYVAERLPEVTLPDDRKRSVAHVFEVRRLVEVPMAELTAQRASPNERADIAEIGASFSAGMPLDEFRRRDREFHAAIAGGCGNPALAELHGKVLESLFRSTDFDSLLYDRRNAAIVRRIIREATDAHRQIGEGIRKGSVPQVRRASEAHLNQVEELMLARMR